MSERNEDMKASWANMREWGKLYFENLKLLSIEKATVLFSQGIMGVLLVILCACAFFFISIALGLILEQVLPVMWCFLIMGGVYLLLGLAVYIFRQPLLTDPIARFLSRLFLDNLEGPSQSSNDDN